MCGVWGLEFGCLYLGFRVWESGVGGLVFGDQGWGSCIWGRFLLGVLYLGFRVWEFGM